MTTSGYADLSRYADLADAYHSRSGLDELRGSTVSWLIGLIAFLGWIDMFWVAESTRPFTWLPMIALYFTAASGLLLSRRSLRTAALSLVLGASAAGLISQIVYPDSGFVVTVAVATLIAMITLGASWGFVTAAVLSALVIVGSQSALVSPVPSGTLELTLLLVWVCAVLGWLSTRSAYTALEWAWSSYIQALDKTEQLLDRQQELNRALKGLDEAYYRLERLNEDLERARSSAEEARRIKTEFATSISHELRTPLNLIIGFSEIMVLSPDTYDSPLPEAYRGDVEAIYRNACHISNLIDDVLDLAQIDAHRMALSRSWVDLPHVVRDAVEATSRLFRDKRLALSVELPLDLPKVFADGVRIRQILINLLNNAARHTDEGGVRVSAWLRKDSDEVVIGVVDTGSGIAPEDLPHVFQEFRQFDRSPGSRYRGSGMGLAISKRFAELHGGNMWVESELGLGSAFYVGLPVQQKTVIESAARDWPRLVHSSTQRDRVLVVADPRRIVTRVFDRYLDGYRVLPAQSVDHARRLAHRFAARAVAVPVDRPGDLPDHLSLQSSLPDVPVLVYSMRTIHDAERDLAVDGYLVKPVTRDQLISALRPIGRGPRTILVVDDDPEMVRLLASMTQSAFKRYRVLTALGGREGLETLRAARPDVVLLDLLMPTVDGYQVLREVRADPDLAGTKVVIISGKGLEDEGVSVSMIGVARGDGLTVGEAMRCAEVTLDSLQVPRPRGETTLPVGTAG